MANQDTPEVYAPSEKESLRGANNWLRGKVSALQKQRDHLEGQLLASECWRKLYAIAALVGWTCLVLYSAFGEGKCTGL